MSEDKILSIYFDRETGKYSSFTVIYLNEKLTKDKVETLVNNWNNNPEQKTNVKLYEDPLLLDLCQDVYATRTFDGFIEDMRNILENIQDYARDLSYQADTIEDYLKDNYPGRKKDE